MVIGAAFVLSALLLGVAASACDHDHLLLATILAFASAASAAMAGFVFGLLAVDAYGWRSGIDVDRVRGRLDRWPLLDLYDMARRAVCSHSEPA